MLHVAMSVSSHVASNEDIKIATIAAVLTTTAMHTVNFAMMMR